MDLRSGILATASSLGINPYDLATVISYETAGTFDPTKRGPTTQWGQHRGLIQFGEPQAQQYGVDWSDPVGSQLGPDGAVARYLRATGVQPGMGLLDVYSAVNAGGVGRYGASDANNGGAPGTVRDKVENQMSGHRRNAEALLGRVSTRGSAPEGAAPMEQQGLLGGKLGEWLTPERRDSLQLALEGMTLNPNQGIMQAASSRMSARQEQQAQAQAAQEAQQRMNQTAQWLQSQGRGDLAEALMAGVIDGRTAFNAMQQGTETPSPYTDIAKLNADLQNGLITQEQYDAEVGSKRKTGYIATGQQAADLGLDPANSYNISVENGVMKATQIGGGGTNVTVNTGQESSEFGEAPKDMVWARDENGNVMTRMTDVGGGNMVRQPIAVPVTGTKAEETATGLRQQQQNALAQSEQMLATIDDILNDPALGYATGSNSFLGSVPGTGAMRARTKIDQLQGQVFLNAYERLKGGGVITEIEGQKAEAALARLNRAQKDEDFVAALKDLRDVVSTARKRAAGNTSMPNTSSTSDDPLGLR